MNKKALMLIALSAASSSSAFAANRINFLTTSANTGRSTFISLPVRSGASRLALLPSVSGSGLAALPTLNENLKLRALGFGKTAYVVPIPVIKLPPLAIIAVTFQNGGQGHFSTIGVDAGLLTKTLDN